MSDAGDFYRKVGEKIRVKRQHRGLSQDGLAKAIGLKRTSLSNIEKGRQNVLLHTFCEIAETLNVSPGELLPDGVKSGLNPPPNLGALRKEVREFVEAGIKPAHKLGR